MQVVFLSLFMGLIIAAIGVFVLYLKKKKENDEDKERYVPTTQDQFPVDYIRSGILKLKNGGFRIVIELSSINIDLMESSEKESVLQLYRTALQSMSFPFQYLQQSRIVDISDYLETINKLKRDARTNFAQNQLEFYSKFLVDLIKERSILTKKFYLIIPYDEEKEKRKTNNYSSFNQKDKKQNKKKNQITPEDQAYEEEQMFEKARKQLYTRASQVEAAFRGLEINPTVLKDNDLLELFYTSYNKDRAVYQPLRDINPKDYMSLRVEIEKEER